LLISKRRLAYRGWQTNYAAHKEKKMPRVLLAVILVILLLAVLPTWPYSTGWGYYPSGGLGLILLIIIVLIVAKRV
jgi:hypothetical protein